MQEQESLAARPPHGMGGQASTALGRFLRTHGDAVRAEWASTLSERAPDLALERTLLYDALPGFLARLADATPAPGDGAPEPQPCSDEHALQRLEQGLSLEHVVLEYTLLRRALHRGMLRVGLQPGLDELEWLHEVLDRGLARATALYTHVHERMLEALERVSEATLASEDLDGFLPKLLRVLQDAVPPVDGASILLREGDGLRLRAAVGVGANEALAMGVQLGLDEGVSGHVAHARRPLLVHEAARHPELRSELVRQLGVRAAYSVPLEHEGALVGVAHMCSRTVFDFSPSDQLLFRVILTRATNFIVQAELAGRERQARASAQRSLAQLATLLEASPVGIGLLDRELRVQHVNEALARLNGPPVAEHLGRTLREVAPPWAAELLEPLFHQVLDTGQPVSNHEFSRPPRPGVAASHWLGNYYPVRGGEGAVVGLSCVVVDITRQKEVETALRRSGELREQLIGVVGHDLRNPLSAISASATLLRRDGTLSAASQRGVERIRTSAARMARMLNDLLDFARSTHGGLPVQRERVDLHELCRGALEELQVAHPRRRLELETRGHGGGWWDPDRLVQVVGNLVGNALHHGDPDAAVHVRVQDLGDDVALSVHNEGEPIPAALQATLFQPFRPGTTGKAARRSVGLGLYIVQQVARAHGGAVEVHSAPGEGTTFTVRLPRGTDPAGT
ncbi:sensor histidine kinase [Archangium primigenium]|uniref:sensor histidine kinase n=1 Tax=[Archangium] primigenium TaxID=2792470 RepID=UPI001958A26A|nr:ATP-binding protein [Archangium primigenium]MBM7112938.1 PAS domain-containing protein [Archangium primigenium]